MLFIEGSHSADIRAVCFLSALTPLEIGENICPLDLVAAHQVILLIGVGNLTLLL